MFLTKKLSVCSFFAKTFSYLPALQRKDWADSVTANYESNLIQALFRHSDVQPKLQPESGFVDRVDLVTNFAEAATKTWAGARI